MNHKQIIFKALTSVSMIAAVVFSLNASGQSISAAMTATDNANGNISSVSTIDQNNAVTPIVNNNNNMTESTQQAKDPVLAWFQEKPWFKNVKLTPSPSINLDELKKYYAANPAYWEKAFEYFKKTDLLALAPGKYPIDGENVFATISEYNTQDPSERQWENHKKYLDVQIILSGKEKMGKAPYAEATPNVPYDETKDIEFRKASNGKNYLAEPGTFFIFFPCDSHMPNQNADGVVKVKKVVFKIKTS
jgi:biofilm protein TabA